LWWGSDAVDTESDEDASEVEVEGAVGVEHPAADINVYVVGRPNDVFAGDFDQNTLAQSHTCLQLQEQHGYDGDGEAATRRSSRDSSRDGSCASKCSIARLASGAIFGAARRSSSNCGGEEPKRHRKKLLRRHSSSSSTIFAAAEEQIFTPERRLSRSQTDSGAAPDPTNGGCGANSKKSLKLHQQHLCPLQFAPQHWLDSSLDGGTVPLLNWAEDHSESDDRCSDSASDLYFSSGSGCDGGNVFAREAACVVPQCDEVARAELPPPRHIPRRGSSITRIAYRWGLSVTDAAEIVAAVESAQSI
jgi:hypothetical protein